MIERSRNRQDVCRMHTVCWILHVTGKVRDWYGEGYASCNRRGTD